jgi:hypothetical protein
MAKLIPLSVIIMSVVIPLIFAGRSRPKADLRLVLWLLIGYILIWTQLCLRVYPMYVFVD